MSNPIVSLFKKLWEFSAGKRHYVIGFVTLSTIAQLIGLLEPLIIGKVLIIIQEQGLTSESLHSLYYWLFSLIVLELAFWIFHGTSRVVERMNSFYVRANYKMHLTDGILNLPAKWHTEHHSGDTIDKVEKATDGLYEFSAHVYEILEMFIRFFGAIFVLAFYNIRSIVPVLVMTGVSVTIVLIMDKKLSRQYKQINQKENDIAAQIYDTISNITTIIILRVEKLLSKEIFKKIMKPLDVFKANVKLNELKWFFVSMCTAVMTVWVLLSYILVQYKEGAVILAGTIYILYGYVSNVSSLFFRFAYRYGDIVRWNAKIDSIKPIVDEFKDKDPVTYHDLSKGWKELVIENLSFSYNEEGRVQHLDNINLIIGKGQRIAFIGESGSGKTTMLKLIRGLYKADSSVVYLDGSKLKDGLKSISHSVTLIPQEPEIFTTTLKRNITLGVSYPKKLISRFIRMSRFFPVLKRLPKKLETNVMEKGVSLSGGEKQRLALARGLIAIDDSELILLDEPTSSVDTRNEFEIYKNIFNYCSKKSVIASIHNLNLLPHFDYIYHFRKGKLIEHGTYDYLIKDGKHFKNILKKYHKKH